uniref:Uncharacterized protein n=1 Tax=Cairina moschata TaxID=8855 RepID=A0A8C3BH99_CAIMO
MRSLLIPAELLCGSGGHDGVGPTPGTITCWARAPQNLAACILGPRHPCLFVTVFALPRPCQEDSGSEKGVEMPTAPQGIGGPSIYNAVEVVFLEFFFWGSKGFCPFLVLLTTFFTCTPIPLLRISLCTVFCFGPLRTRRMSRPWNMSREGL